MRRLRMINSSVKSFQSVVRLLDAADDGAAGGRSR
jgi:hypothetical protein